MEEYKILEANDDESVQHITSQVYTCKTMRFLVDGAEAR